MSRSNKWKRVERKVARYLGGERNPLSGGASRHTRGDAILPSPIYLEVKDGAYAMTYYRSRKRLIALFEDTEAKAKAEGKIPLVVLHPNGWGGGVGTYPAYVRVFGGDSATTAGIALPAGTVVQVPLAIVKESPLLPPSKEAR